MLWVTMCVSYHGESGGGGWERERERGREKGRKGLTIYVSLSSTTHTHIADNAFKGQAVDVWAAGITLFVFIFGRVS